MFYQSNALSVVQTTALKHWKYTKHWRSTGENHHIALFDNLLFTNKW